MKRLLIALVTCMVIAGVSGCGDKKATVAPASNVQTTDTEDGDEE